VKIFKIIVVTFTLLAGYSHQTFAVGLDGAGVEFAVHCCASSSTFNQRSDLLTSTVGNGVEFPSIEESGFQIAAADIDISSTQIEINYIKSARFGTGKFNGYVFEFTSIRNLADIKGVSLNSATTLRSGAVQLSFESNTVRISLAGQRVTSRSRIVVDVSFTSSSSQRPPFIPSAPLSNNQCIARYAVNGALYIPCIAVSDALGAITLYKANLALLSSPPLDTTFKLLDVQQARSTSMMSNRCLARYSTKGNLDIPCLAVPSPFGGDLIYHVNMELIPFSSFSSPYIFKLIKTNQLN
jgi:hypothetical protein